MRGFARKVPLRTPAQFLQPQFHCGKPPPAAEPSTRTNKRHAFPYRQLDRCANSDAVEIFLVGPDFGIHFNLDERRELPNHGFLQEIAASQRKGRDPIPRSPQSVKAGSCGVGPGSGPRAGRDETNPHRKRLIAAKRVLRLVANHEHRDVVLLDDRELLCGVDQGPAQGVARGFAVGFEHRNHAFQ